MGLDNGVILKKQGEDEEREVAYFRKYYGLRDAFMGYLEDKYYRDCDNNRIFLDEEDLDMLAEKIKEINEPESFRIATHGIWVWSNEIHDMLMNYIENLKTAAGKLSEGGYTCYWYDSY